MDRPRQLRHILKATFAEEIEDLPVPFIILQGVDSILSWIDRRGEHAVRQGHDSDDGGRSPSVRAHLDTLCEDGGLRSIRIHIGGADDRWSPASGSSNLSATTDPTSMGNP